MELHSLLVVVWPEAIQPWSLGLSGRVISNFQEGLCQGGPSWTATAMPPSLLTHTSTGDSPTPDSSFGSVSFGLLLLSSVSQCAQDFVCTLQDWNLFPPFLWKSYYQIPLAFKIRFPGDSQSLCGIPRTFTIVGALLWYHFLQFVGHPLGGMQFGFTMIAPFLPSHCGLFFVFGCGWQPASSHWWLFNS